MEITAINCKNINSNNAVHSYGNWSEPILFHFTNLGSFIEEHLPEDVIIYLNSGHGGRGLLIALADHDSVSGQDPGLLGTHVEGNGVDEALGVDLVVVNGPTIPDLFGGLVIDIGEVTEREDLKIELELLQAWGAKN